MGQVDLGADGIRQVADHEHVLDVVVEVVLDVEGVDLGGEREVVHEVLAQGLVGVALLVEDLADVARAALEQVLGLCEGADEALDVGQQRGGAGLVVGGGGDGLQGGAVGIAGGEAVGHLDEEAGLGGAVGVDGGRGRDVALGLDVLAGLGRDGQVDGRVGEGARLRGGEEVLDQGGEGVELQAGGVPAQEGLAGAGLEGELEHGPLVLDVHLDLVLVLDVWDREAVPDLNLGAILGAHTYEGADNAGFGRVGVCGRVGDVVVAGGMVEDGEDSL